MSIRSVSAVGILLITSVLCRSAAGQNNPSGLSGMGVSGLSGATTGSTTSGSSTTGTRSSTTGTQSTTGTFGSSTTGMNGAETNRSNASQVFIGGNATQGFVGGAREATQTQNMNRQFQAIENTQAQRSTESQQSGTPRSIRTAISIGFSFPSVSNSAPGRLAVANEISLARFTSVRPEFSAVRIQMSPDGTAILTGSAPTTDSRRLAANLMRLQPGVRRVDNQISVAQ